MISNIDLKSPPKACLYFPSCPGFLAPVALWSSFLLLGLPENSPARLELCSSLLLARNTIWLLNGNICLFTILWRSFLILHSEKGFVDKGQPNLKLFNQLFWVVVFSNTFLEHFMFPFTHIAKGGFPENSHKGRICLLLDADPTVDYEWKKYKLFPITFCILSIVYCSYTHIRIKRFLRGFCPNKRYSCILTYKRNILNFKTSLVWADIVFFYGVFDFLVLTVLNEYRYQMSRKTRYMIWNTSSSLLMEVLHLLIPLLVVIPKPSRTGAQLGEFYVRRPVLEPRRPESPDKDNESWTKVLEVQEARRAGQSGPDNICRPGPSWQH